MAFNLQEREKALDRRLSKMLRKAASSQRLDAARAALEFVAGDLPVDDHVVREYLHLFRTFQVVPETDDDDPLEVVASDLDDVADETGSVADFRRYQAVESLSWAGALASGDDRDVNYPAVEGTIACALLVCRDDPARRDALLADVRDRLAPR